MEPTLGPGRGDDAPQQLVWATGDDPPATAGHGEGHGHVVMTGTYTFRDRPGVAKNLPTVGDDNKLAMKVAR